MVKRCAEPTHYQTLGVPKDIGAEALHQHYKQLALQHHPDKATARERKQHVVCALQGIQRPSECGVCRRTVEFSAVTEAYSVLKDAKRRRLYDEKLRLLGNYCPKCDGAGTVRRTKGFTTVVQVTCPQCKGSGRRGY